MAFRSSGLAVRCDMACAPRSTMMTRPPISRPKRRTLMDTACGVGRGRPSRLGRWFPTGVGDGGGWVLGDGPPPGDGAMVSRSYPRSGFRVPGSAFARSRVRALRVVPVRQGHPGLPSGRLPGSGARAAGLNARTRERRIPSIVMANVQHLKQRVCQAIDRRASELIETADWIHAHPEIGHQEVEASRRLSGMLQAAGIPVEMGTAGMATAFKAELGG